LVPEEVGEGFGLARDVEEPLGEGVVADLVAVDFDVLRDGFMQSDVGVAVAHQGAVESTREESGFEAGDEQHGVLGQRDTLDGEDFLRV
jgi:hypothetical protein